MPVIYVAFDVLALARRARRRPWSRCCACPLRERRARLEALGLAGTPGFGLAALVSATDAAELAGIFDAAQARGNEGLMVKDPDSIYAPGRRGYAWLKLKKALTTLDCVVVGVEVGHGRRHGVLSDYTFAVLDDRPDAAEGRLVTIGKAYSGLTDAEIAEMTRWFEAHTLSHPRPVPRRGADASWWRSPSTSSIARPATPRATRCASRASCASATTRAPPRSTG